MDAFQLSFSYVEQKRVNIIIVMHQGQTVQLYKIGKECMGNSWELPSLANDAKVIFKTK